MSVSETAWFQRIRDYIDRRVSKTSTFNATVSAINGDGSVMIVDAGAGDTPFDQPAWLLEPAIVAVGDLVVVLPMIDDSGAESFLVLGGISDGTLPDDPSDLRTGGPVSPTNGSTTAYNSLLSEPFSLPTGIWTLKCAVIANFSNSAANSGATGRFSSPATGSATNIETATLNNLMTMNFAQEFTGLSGNVTIGFEYRARNGGTVTAGRWTLVVIAKRTA